MTKPNIEPLKHKPFASLPPVLTTKSEQAAKKPKKENKEFTEPVFVKKLYDHFGTGTLAGKAIGVTGGVITGGIRDNSCTLTTELAARGYYEREISPPPIENTINDHVFISMVIHKDNLKPVKEWFDDNGVKYKVF